MGAVYVAYDPELDRKVALKLLHGESSPKHRRALLMEAQAMAKLTHPNVVAVHDVGEHEQMVYLAMEYIDGVTLRRWVGEERRGWRVVLDRFLDAGRGLAAAHATGLIHRDFKPDNVMIADGGRPVVLDFGLARPTREAASLEIDDESLSGALLSEATVGRVAGTPAYMAPEQAMGSELTPAVDQFSFCVSLWEALHGQRPFDGPTYAQMLKNVADGKVRSGGRRRAPTWLRRCLQRGMRPDADQRWPSMHELLVALERGRQRWRWQASALGVLAVAVPLGVSAEQDRRQQREREAQIEACVSQGESILEVWNDDARERLREGMRSTGASFAEDSVNTLVPWLDDFVQTWKQGRTDVCLHANVERDWTEDDTERALWCLEDRQLQLEATVAQISAADRTAARRAVRLASYLDPVETCLDTTLLERLPAPPPELRDEIRSVRKRLIESDRLRHQGEPKLALEHAVTARGLAEDVAWPPLLASARMIEGRCLHESRQRSKAIPVLIDAFFEAQRVGSLEVAFRAARTLMTSKLTLGEYDDALIWSRHADAVARDNADPGRLDEAEKHYLYSMIHRGRGEWKLEIDEAARAFDIRSQTLGPKHPITAAAQLGLAEGYIGLSRPEDALPLAKAAYATWLDAVGPDHPSTIQAARLCAQAALDQRIPEDALPFIEGNIATFESSGEEKRLAESLYQLGRAYQLAHRLADATDALDRATTLFRKLHGSKSRPVAAALVHGCLTAKLQGRFEIATAKCEETVEIMTGLEDARGDERAQAVEALAGVLTDVGRADEAVARRLEALSWREALSGSNDRGLVAPLGSLGDAQVAAEEPGEARGSYERALEIAAAALEPDNRRLVRPLCGLAEVLLAEGEGERALELAQRASSLATQHELRPPLSSRAAFVLARALVAGGGSEDDSRALAERARDGYASAGYPSKVEVIDAWLDRR